VEHILVIGTDTTAGANIATEFSDRYNVSTWAPEDKYDVANCTALSAEETPAETIESARPDCVVYCGPAARSCWEPETAQHITEEMVEDAELWAKAAQAHGCRFVMISSDAIFTGPWMFHEEDSPGICHSAESLTIRATEECVLDACADALILRANVYGWSPNGENGWLESLLEDVRENRVVEQNHICHGSPILGTDLANIIERACQENLAGIYHAGGAERVSPLKFTQRLADTFDLPWLAVRKESVLYEVPTGFAEGESSLQTKKLRKALCVAMPLLSEGLDRLRSQHESANAPTLPLQVAEKAPLVIPKEWAA